MSLQLLSGGSPISPLFLAGWRAGILFQLLDFVWKYVWSFCLFMLLGVEALCSDKLAMSKSSFRILIISFADFSSDAVSLNSNFSSDATSLNYNFSSDTAPLNYNFNSIQHSHSNLLSSGVLFVKSGLTSSYTTAAAAMLKYVLQRNDLSRTKSPSKPDNFPVLMLSWLAHARQNLLLYLYAWGT